MRRILLLVSGLTCAAGTGWAAPPLGSRLGSEVRDEKPEDEATAARRGHVFASCMVNKRTGLARQLLAQIDEKGYEKVYRDLTSGEHECFNPGLDDATHLTYGWKLKVPPALMRGLIAEHLIKHDMANFTVLPALPRQLLYSRPWYVGTTRYAQVDEMATCAAETAPAQIIELLKTDPYSNPERAAIGVLAPTLGACLRAGFQLNPNRQALRAALAEALYQRTQPWPVTQPTTQTPAPATTPAPPEPAVTIPGQASAKVKEERGL